MKIEPTTPRGRPYWQYLLPEPSPHVGARARAKFLTNHFRRIVVGGVGKDFVTRSHVQDARRQCAQVSLDNAFTIKLLEGNGHLLIGCDLTSGFGLVVL
jgi:hypothetical protein